jgi:hypothetical protein
MTGQILTKVDNYDYNTQWSDLILNLDAMSDVTISAVSKDQVLLYNGTNWKNENPMHPFLM